MEGYSTWNIARQGAGSQLFSDGAAARFAGASTRHAPFREHRPPCL
jgi:hypothetical protein